MEYKMYYNVIIPSRSKNLTWNSKIQKEGGGKKEQSGALEGRVLWESGSRNSASHARFQKLQWLVTAIVPSSFFRRVKKNIVCLRSLSYLMMSCQQIPMLLSVTHFCGLFGFHSWSLSTSQSKKLKVIKMNPTFLNFWTSSVV